MLSAPTCPRDGHDQHVVVKDGIQRSDQRPRQRWRCTAPGGEFLRTQFDSRAAAFSL